MKILSPTLVALALSATQLHAEVVTFDEASLALAPDTFFNPEATTTFSSGGLTFDHFWEFGCCWGGTTYSNRTDTTTPTFVNQRSAITGDGAGMGQDNYAIVTNPFSLANSWQFGGQTILDSFDITNTTFAFLAMRDGDAAGTSFEVTPFSQGDFFDVILNGLDASNNIISTQTIRLAQDDQIIDAWTTINLTSLGVINGLSFEFDSSQNNASGNVVPAYFAVDNISYQAVPVPAAIWLLGSALAGLATLRRKN